jgi:hypothetical protein
MIHMSEQERNRHAERLERTPAGTSAATDAAALQDARRSANAHLAAAQAAINQALSGNSLAFNNALRQRGGQ